MSYKVAIIGSGPSAFYAAQALFKSELSIQVDMFEKLPTPFGLLRGGVAPDHQQMKTVAKSYEKIALVDAGSNFSFKDPVILYAWQSKMNKALERLKVEAASLGANGILIVNTDNMTYQSINSNKNGAQSSTYEEKLIKSIAIHVPEI